VQEFINVRYIGQVYRITGLMGKKKDYSHDRNHGNTSIPGVI
jgi:hypothetical protein